MAGYCTLVGAVYLSMAPLAYRALTQSPANKIKKRKLRQTMSRGDISKVTQ